MSKTIRLTMAQALARFLARQMTEIDGEKLPLFGGVWAIFGHGNVAGIGEALYGVRDELPTFRAHNEQAMAHAAIAYAKAMRRRRMMACTTSIGPGATNMVTAAALAHVNRLPVLLLPGDVFANRAPDPVLQQVEDFGDGTVSANDCFRPVSRYFDRITRPEQILAGAAARHAGADRSGRVRPGDAGALPGRAGRGLRLSRRASSRERVWRRAGRARTRASSPRRSRRCRRRKKPLIIAGGGVLYSRGRGRRCAAFAERAWHSGRRDAGRQVVRCRDDHPLNMGAVGVTGTSAANALAERGRRRPRRRHAAAGFHHRLVGAVQGRRDASSGSTCSPSTRASTARCRWSPTRSDGLEALDAALGGWQAPRGVDRATRADGKADWQRGRGRGHRADQRRLPSDAQVIGAVQRALGRATTSWSAPPAACPASCTSSGRPAQPGGYHLEYGYSCMGYEIAGGLGVKMAKPDREVVVHGRRRLLPDAEFRDRHLGDARAEAHHRACSTTAASAASTGCSRRPAAPASTTCSRTPATRCCPTIDFAAHARSLGAHGREGRVDRRARGGARARAARRRAPRVIVIDTDPLIATDAGGHWWDVAVPEVVRRGRSRRARGRLREGRELQRVGD